MIPFINNCTFTGRLTKEPQFKEIGEDRKVTNATIAVNNRRKVGGEWKDDAMFVNVEAWGVAATMLAVAEKGHPVVASGQLFVEKYEVDGQPRQSLKLVANSVGPLEESRNSRPEAAEDTDDDVPF